MRHEDLTSNVAAFCAYLRAEHDFSIGMGETQEALRAMQIIGVDDVTRVRAALRAICCTARDQLAPFDREFDAFFLEPERGARQSESMRRRGEPAPPARRPPRESTGTRPLHAQEGDVSDAAEQWEALRARYSAAPAQAAPPRLDAPDSAMLGAAGRFVARIRRGRSRRWAPQPRGRRIDVRGTLRASLQSGGEPRLLRRLGHPLRNPRFVVLIDGSRSMTEYATRALTLAYALRRRCVRTRVFVFSTELREVTRAVRSVQPGDLGNLGEAWGGGTRIGSSLRDFLHRYGASVTEEAFLFVISDGLELGDTSKLERAVHEMRRSGASVVWINPLLALEGYTPSSRGMQAVLPFLDDFIALEGSRTFDAIVC
jgi:uncharacterized protein with von Willebrand factor type A (vWA) domain